MKRALLAGVLAAAIAGSAALASPPAAWQRAAAELKMPVFWPTNTLGLRLLRVKPQHIQCGRILEQLDAFYSGSGGRAIRVTEGRPFYCGDIGDAPLLSHPRVHGVKADLYRYCEGRGCGKVSAAFLLLWRERGVQLVLITRNLPKADVLKVADSMHVVPG